MKIYAIIFFLFFTNLHYMSLKSEISNPDITCTFRQSPNLIPEQPAPTMSITYQNPTGITCCPEDSPDLCKENLKNSAIRYCKNPPTARGNSDKPTASTNIPEDYKELEPVKTTCGTKILEFKPEK